eukprot:2133443-Pyramimonas_sp.AAC.1
MKSWSVASEMVYFLEGFPIQDVFEKARSDIMHSLCRSSDEESAGQGGAEFMLTSSDVASVPSKLTLLEQLAEAGLCLRLAAAP